MIIFKTGRCRAALSRRAKIRARDRFIEPFLVSVRHRGKKISTTTSRHMCPWSSSSSSSSPPLPISRPFVALIFSMPSPRHVDSHGDFNVSLRSSLETSSRRNRGEEDPGKSFFAAIRGESARPRVLEFSRVVAPQKAAFPSAMTAAFHLNENSRISISLMFEVFECVARYNCPRAKIIMISRSFSNSVTRMSDRKSVGDRA